MAIIRTAVLNTKGFLKNYVGCGDCLRMPAYILDQFDCARPISLCAHGTDNLGEPFIRRDWIKFIVSLLLNWNVILYKIRLLICTSEVVQDARGDFH